MWLPPSTFLPLAPDGLTAKPRDNYRAAGRHIRPDCRTSPASPATTGTIPRRRTPAGSTSPVARDQDLSALSRCCGSVRSSMADSAASSATPWAKAAPELGDRRASRSSDSKCWSSRQRRRSTHCAGRFVVGWASVRLPFPERTHPRLPQRPTAAKPPRPCRTRRFAASPFRLRWLADDTAGR
jgi:hypothetical protein